MCVTESYYAVASRGGRPRRATPTGLDFLLVLLVLLLNSYKRETATAFVLFGLRPP